MIAGAAPWRRAATRPSDAPAGGARRGARAHEARVQPARAALQAQLELVGGARPGRVGARRAAAGVRAVVARVVQRGPAAPGAAAPPCADLRADVAAARASRGRSGRSGGARRSTRVVRHPAAEAVAPGPGRSSVNASARAGAAAANVGRRPPSGRGGGAQLQCLSAGETVAGHDDRNTGGPAKHRSSARRADPCTMRCTVHARGAVGAAAAQHDVVPADGVAEPRRRRRR